MATIAQLQILMTAKADGLNRTVDGTVNKLRTYVKTVDAMKDAKMNFAASTVQVQAAVIQTKRLVQNLTRTPIAVKIQAAVDRQLDKAASKLNQLRKSPAAIKLTLAGERVFDSVALKTIGVRKAFDSLSVRASAATNIAGIRMARMFEPMRQKASGAAAWVQAKVGKLGLQGVMPVGAGDVMKSLGPIGRLAKSGVRIPIAFAAQGLTVGTGLAKAALGGLKAAGGAAVGVIGTIAKITAGGVLVAGAALLVLTHKSMEAIDVNAKLADRLGATSEGLVGLQHAGNLAGVNSEMLTGAMEKMLKTLGGMADDGEAATNVFSKLGLSASELASIPADAAFTKIAGKIAAIENPTERATAAMQIFGKSGQSLLPLLMSGAEGIKAAQEEAQKLGLTYSRLDAAKVEQANDAMTKMGEVATGVGNQLAIGLAPYIEAAANKMTELATSGGGLGPTVGGAIEWVAKAIATAADYLQLLPAGFHGFRAAALTAIGTVIDQLDKVGQSFVDLMNLIPGVNVQWSSAFSEMRDGMDQIAGEEAAKMNDALASFARGDNAKSVGTIFDDIKKKSAEAAKATADNGEKMRKGYTAANADVLSKVQDDVQKQVDSLRDQAGSVGGGTGSKELADLAKQQAALAKMKDDIRLQMKGTADPKQLAAYADQLKSIDVTVNFTAKGVDDVKKAIRDLQQAEITKSIADAGDKIKQLRAKLDDDTFALTQKGASKAQVDQFVALKRKASDLENAKSIGEEFKSNADKLAARLAEIARAAKADPSLSQDVINRAVDKAKQDFAADSTPMQTQVAAVERRSSDGLVNTERSTDIIAKKQLDEAKKQTTALTNVADNLGKNKLAVVSLDKLS